LRAVIFANGWLSHPILPQPGDLVIAADGGARHCLDFGFQPKIVVGDFDSLDERHIDILRAAGARFVRYPSRKDHTDLELALQLAQDLGADEILIQGALGDRWDQTVANILLPAAFSTTRIRLVDGPQEIYFLHGGEQLELSGQPGDTLSLIPLAGNAHGITTHNLEYPLVDDELIFGSTRGVSNVMRDERAAVSLRDGVLLCILIRSSVKRKE
jgi:thiamine pyrophosphokinase